MEQMVNNWAFTEHDPLIIDALVDKAIEKLEQTGEALNKQDEQEDGSCEDDAHGRGS